MRWNSFKEEEGKEKRRRQRRGKGKKKTKKKKREIWTFLVKINNFMLFLESTDSSCLSFKLLFRKVMVWSKCLTIFHNQICNCQSHFTWDLNSIDQIKVTIQYCVTDQFTNEIILSVELLTHTQSVSPCLQSLGLRQVLGTCIAHASHSDRSLLNMSLQM